MTWLCSVHFLSLFSPRRRLPRLLSLIFLPTSFIVAITSAHSSLPATSLPTTPPRRLFPPATNVSDDKDDDKVRHEHTPDRPTVSLTKSLAPTTPANLSSLNFQRQVHIIIQTPRFGRISGSPPIVVRLIRSHPPQRTPGWPLPQSPVPSGSSRIHPFIFFTVPSVSSAAAVAMPASLDSSRPIMAPSVRVSLSPPCSANSSSSRLLSRGERERRRGKSLCFLSQPA